MKKDKRGVRFLGEHVINIVIAALVLIFLFYLGSQLYASVTGKSDLEKAENTIERIESIIKNLDGNKEAEVTITNPKDWYIISYEEGKESPGQCGGKNCLCICPRTEIEDCDKEGVCKIGERIVIDEIIRFGGIGEDVDFDEFYERDNPNSGKSGLTISVGNYIPLKVPLNLYLRKTNGIIKMSVMRMDTRLMVDFLKRGVEFEGQKTMEEVILNLLFKDCSEPPQRSMWSGQVQVDEELENFIKSKSEEYLGELITAGQNRGGKIIFTTTDKIWFYNVIVVDKGDGGCSVVEEKLICSREVSTERVVRGYVRLYICN